MNRYQARRLIWLAAVAIWLTLGLPVGAQRAAIDRALLLHDSRNDLFRTPSGAVPLKSQVTLRLQSAADNLDSASVDVLNSASGKETLLPMHIAAVMPDGRVLWEASLDVGNQPALLTYRFQVTQNDTTWYYEDDTRPNGFDFVEANKGGVGAVYEQSPNAPYQIAVYRSDFYTPEWMRNAVVYQIFPDRFRDGDPSNDPADGSDVFYGDLPLIFHETWNEAPVDGRTTQAPSGAGYYNSDFYGGDLAGIVEKLDYLQSLGVTAIYLNPIFEARSNHRYDTADYLKIDPILGNLDTFRTLVSQAKARGIHLILDGVFNHVSSDSAYFDRYHRFPSDGACESLNSRYRSWFTFVPPKAGQPNACVETPKDETYYASWAGFDSIPRLNSPLVDVRRAIYLDKNSVVHTWMNEGIGGWRLDVANEIDDGSASNNYWETFRTVVRSIDPEAVIIGEEWNDASRWLTGDQWDSTMNYRFRRAILGFARQTDFIDNDGRIPALAPSAFDASVRAVEEDTPPMAYHALMNLLDSHDTTRLRFALDNDAQAQKLAALIEFTLPGAPTIYYGDEIALDAPDIPDSGGVLQDDPYNRAPYPWPDTSGNHYPPPDADMLAFYQKLTALRNANPALRQGKMVTLVTDDNTGVYAYLRVDPDAANVALIVANHGDKAQTVTIDLGGLIPNNLILTPALGNGELANGQVTVAPRSGEVWVGSGDPASFALPDVPTGLQAVGSAGNVRLSWQPVAGADGYIVYRSPVAVGGFERLNETPVADAAYADNSVSNGFQYYYTVAAVGSGGLIGAQSASVGVSPSLTPDRLAYVDTPETQSVELVQGAVVSVSAAIHVGGLTDAEGRAPGILAQAALVPADASLDQAEWQPMDYSRDEDGADVYSAALAPADIGRFDAVVRFSTDAGNHWQTVTYVDGSFAQVDVVASSDTTPPDAPANVAVERASVSGVALRWDAVDDAASYRVYRAGTDGDMQPIGDVPAGGETRYVDKAVVENQRYTYGVTALDGALNESAITKTEPATVKRVMVAVTFAVEVPANASGDLYLAGSFGSTDYPTWDPAGIPMTRIDATHWSVTLNLSEGASVEYKFTRGRWEQVEKGAQCEEIPNRRLTVVLGDDAGVSVTDNVQKWRDVDCSGG